MKTFKEFIHKLFEVAPSPTGSGRMPYGTPGADKPFQRQGYKDNSGKFVDFDNPSTWPSIKNQVKGADASEEEKRRKKDTPSLRSSGVPAPTPKPSAPPANQPPAPPSGEPSGEIKVADNSKPAGKITGYKLVVPKGGSIYSSNAYYAPIYDNAPSSGGSGASGGSSASA